MIAITDHTEKSSQEYKAAWIDLIQKLKDRGYINEKFKSPSIHGCSDGLHRKSGYAKVEYNGSLKQDLGDLTSLQVAMLCDGGYSWFGGSCSKDGLKFYVKIYTD